MKLIKKILTPNMIIYIITGIFTTILNISITYILYNKLNLNENLVTLLSWIIVVFASYICNARWVFESKYINVNNELIKISKFYLTRLFTYIIEAFGIFVFVTIFRFNFWIMKIIFIIIVVILNYILAKYKVFNDNCT